MNYRKLWESTYGDIPKDDITLGLDYKNENDYPLVDHCI